MGNSTSNQRRNDRSTSSGEQVPQPDDTDDSSVGKS